ncbi:MAG: YggS family pyridoxal phosphate-dependent enzyme [Bacteroidetes bacterium]|nr:YggS family pyridoxal phosphate-dependent enzyme [Bacteroidota bacterium]
MDVVGNFKEIRKTIPAYVTLVAVSKFHPSESILQLYKETGHLIYGESRAQEFASKFSLLPSDLKWHFIGHLQTNKVKMVIPGVSMIQSVDSYKLLKEINRHSLSLQKVTEVLLQFHIATEESKFGFSLQEAMDMLHDRDFEDMSNVKVRGVMGMATFTSDTRIVGREFKTLRSFFEDIKREYYTKEQSFNEVSMGMSDDYLLAIQEGSTMVRIGSSIFGSR